MNSLAMLTGLLDRLDRLERLTISIREAVVTGVEPLSVTLGGSAVPADDVQAIGAEYLTIGQDVAVVLYGGRLLVLGPLAGGLGIDNVIGGEAIAPGAILGSEHVVVGSIDTEAIAFDAIEAEHISVEKLSAITADLGEIIAGIITGATIQTSVDGARVILDEAGLRILGGDGTTGTVFPSDGGEVLLSGRVYARGGTFMNAASATPAPTETKARWRNAATGSDLVALFGAVPGYRADYPAAGSLVVSAGDPVPTTYAERILARAGLKHYWTMSQSAGGVPDAGPGNRPLAKIGTGIIYEAAPLISAGFASAADHPFSTYWQAADLAWSPTTAFSMELWVANYSISAGIVVERPGQFRIETVFVDTQTYTLHASVWVAGVKKTVVTPAGEAYGSKVALGVTFDGSNLRLYRNGVLVATTAAAGSISASSAATRASPSNGTHIDEYSIYNSVLSAGEFAASHAIGRTGSLVNLERLVIDSDGRAEYPQLPTPVKNRTYYGRVTSAGGIAWAGSGRWTVVRNALGLYTITIADATTELAPVFGLIPAVSGAAIIVLTSLTAAAFQINIITTAGVAKDAAFTFNCPASL